MGCIMRIGVGGWSSNEKRRGAFIVHLQDQNYIL